jgi:hypothetical protein
MLTKNGSKSVQFHGVTAIFRPGQGSQIQTVRSCHQESDWRILMPSEQLLEVYRQFRMSQDKYAYFLLAAVGGGIALAVNQTHTAALSWSQIPLACAVLLWGLSFLFGCRYLSYLSSNLYANVGLLKVESGEHPLVGTHPDLMAAASEGIRDAIESNAEKGSRFARWQFYCLALGAVAYLAWHILEMWLRT